MKWKWLNKILHHSIIFGWASCVTEFLISLPDYYLLFPSNQMICTVQLFAKSSLGPARKSLLISIMVMMMLLYISCCYPLFYVLFLYAVWWRAFREYLPCCTLQFKKRSNNSLTFHLGQDEIQRCCCFLLLLNRNQNWIWSYLISVQSKPGTSYLHNLRLKPMQS